MAASEASQKACFCGEREIIRKKEKSGGTEVSVLVWWGGGVRCRGSEKLRRGGASDFQCSAEQFFLCSKTSSPLYSSIPPSKKLTELSRQKTEASLVGARSAEESRPCAEAPRESDVTTIEAGAAKRMQSSAHEDHALPLLAAAEAAAVKFLMTCREREGSRGQGERMDVPLVVPLNPEKFSRALGEKKVLESGGRGNSTSFFSSHFFSLVVQPPFSLRSIFRAARRSVSRAFESRKRPSRSAVCSRKSFDVQQAEQEQTRKE